MTTHFWESESAFIWEALLISVLVHGAIAFSGRLPADMFPSRNTVEIDLTHSARIGGLARRRAASAPARVIPPPKPQEWVVPKKPQSITQPPQPKVAEPPKVEEPPSPIGNTGPADGSESTSGMMGGDGYMNVTQVSRYPQLLNLAELQSNLRRFYPEVERLKRNEGQVTLEIHIGADGKVASANVVKSSSPAFEEAAKKVATLLKFKPAMVGREKVAVKLRQTIEFKLEE